MEHGNAYSSEEINKLAECFAQAQAAYPIITFNKKDAYFDRDYTDYDNMMRPIRPILAAHGLVFLQQQRISEQGITMLHSLLLHSSGQWIESRTRIIPGTEGVAAYESELMTQRKNAAKILLNISIQGDDADDNGAASLMDIRNSKIKGTAPNLHYENISRETILKEQLDELEYELGDYTDIAKDILRQFKLTTLADMPKSKYSFAIRKVRELKQIREGLK